MSMRSQPMGTVEVHQVLHGYREGHELLSASTQLPPSARRTMLVLSDLSGDGAVRGFTEYLTGYPLDEPSLFAFARTWYAAEMPRPGCVWTHTLLISFADLAQIGALSDLSKYFRRPNAKDVAFAQSPISHSVSDVAELPAYGAEGSEQRAELVEALYRDSAPVLIPTDDASQLEPLVLSICAQQWPRLRRIFAFCTGSLDSRSLDRRPFDLQVVPRSRARRVARTLEHCTLVEVGSVNEASGVPVEASEWARAAASYLGQGNETFRDWLKRFGADVCAERRSFAALSLCYVKLQIARRTGTSLRALVRTLAEGFPDPDDALTLKTSLLAGMELLPESGTQTELLQELLVSPDINAFDRAQEAMFRRIEKTWRKDGRWDRDELVWLLTNDGLNDFGRKLADRATSELVPEDLTHIYVSSRGTFIRLLTRRPELAANDWLWHQSQDLQRAALDAMQHMPTEGRARVVDAMCDASALNAIDDFVDREAEAAIDLIMASLQRHYANGGLDEMRWQRFFSRRENLIVQWLASTSELDPTMVRFVAVAWGPHSNGVRRLGYDVFGRALSQTIAGTNVELADDLAAFCLALGLSGWTQSALKLVHDSFQRVHDAVMQSRLGGTAWHWLLRSVPSAGWFSTQDWDRGEKLRRALVDAFLRNGWDPRVFAQTVRNPDTRRRTIEYCRDSRRGRELLRASGLWIDDDD